MSDTTREKPGPSICNLSDFSLICLLAIEALSGIFGLLDPLLGINSTSTLCRNETICLGSMPLDLASPQRIRGSDGGNRLPPNYIEPNGDRITIWGPDEKIVVSQLKIPNLNWFSSFGGGTLVTAASLKAHTSKDLAQMAKKKGVEGWHSMRKDQLVKALLKVAKQKQKEKGLGKRSSLKAKSSRTSKSTSDSAIAKKIRIDRQRAENLKNLAAAGEINGRGTAPTSDRLILVVRDSYWLQAYWEITRATVQRAKVALAGFWHNAKPIIRLLEITSDGNTNSVEKIVQEIEIHSGVNNWYLKCNKPGKTYRIAIGYTAPGQKFHLIAKSNEVTPPASNVSEIDDHWTDITNDVEKYYALSGGYESQTVTGDLQEVFEEKSRQPMHAPAFERLGSGINSNGQGFSFQVDAHMIVHGSTDPNASVTVGGEPVRLQSDGTFALRMNLPDRRQVLPVVASSRDGTQQRTTVLAVERNTKVMEPVTNEFEH